MDVILLNVMGSAAVASAVVVAAMTNRLSKELAGLSRRDTDADQKRGS